MADREFRELFEESYRPATSYKSIKDDIAFSRALGLPGKLGHPEFEHLDILETAEADITVLFIDIRGFTRLSFELENEELIRILQALTAASIKAIVQAGGYVGQFTGDGVMAYFGDSRTSSEQGAFSALATAAMLMAGVREVVNPQLKSVGDEPIRVAIGMEYGVTLWSRIGLRGASEVKPVSEVTFFAGKLATKEFTSAWECKIGEQLAAWLPDAFKKDAGAYTFEVDGATRKRSIFFFDWRQFVASQRTDSARLRQKLLEKRLAPALGSLAASARSGLIPNVPPPRPDKPGPPAAPRPAKDRPVG